MKSWLSAGYPILWGAEVDDTFLDFSTAQVWTGPLDGGQPAVTAPVTRW